MGTSSSKNKVQKGGKLVIGMNRLKGEFVSTEHFSYYQSVVADIFSMCSISPRYSITISLWLTKSLRRVFQHSCTPLRNLCSIYKYMVMVRIACNSAEMPTKKRAAALSIFAFCFPLTDSSPSSPSSFLLFPPPLTSFLHLLLSPFIH